MLLLKSHQDGQQQECHRCATPAEAHSSMVAEPLFSKTFKALKALKHIESCSLKRKAAKGLLSAVFSSSKEQIHGLELQKWKKLAPPELNFIEMHSN